MALIPCGIAFTRCVSVVTSTSSLKIAIGFTCYLCVHFVLCNRFYISAPDHPWFVGIGAQKVIRFVFHPLAENTYAITSAQYQIHSTDEPAPDKGSTIELRIDPVHDRDQVIVKNQAVSFHDNEGRWLEVRLFL